LTLQNKPVLGRDVATAKQTTPRTIAIDGPVASGKSAVGSLLSRRLGYRFLDTGVMYRAFAWWTLEQGVDPRDEEAVGKLAQTVRMDVSTAAADNDAFNRIEVGGVDATPFLARPDVEANVSLVSRVPAVRAAMVAIQRRMVESGGVIVVGRDIGTVVLPDAALKVYLDASREERARRRYVQAKARGDTTTLDAVLQELARRDKIDSSRKASPLRPADDAIILNTDGLELEQVVDKILAMTR